MKILIVSNGAFSDSGSNSRTIKNFLFNVKKENLAQLYIHGTPDMSFCDRYFGISDRDALSAFLHKKPENQGEMGRGGNTKGTHSIKKSYRNLCIRNIVWQSLAWWSDEFDEFLSEFSPDVVLLQAGDAPFMYKTARRIAKKYSAKLVMYNSESYVLKRHMYSRGGGFFHSFLMRSLRRQYRKFMKHADFCIYSMEELERAYQARYPHPGRSMTLYTTSTMEKLPDASGDVFSLLYCGNLGVGRDIPLSEIARVLYRVSPEARLDIYGKFPSAEAEERVCANPNVVYHGFVDYSEIPSLMSSATMLLHVENPERLEDLRYAFSTKIADSLASGRPFLVYAPREYPFVKYLSDNFAAHIAENPSELEELLRLCMTDEKYKNQSLDAALSLARLKHSKEKNCEYIDNILDSLFESEENI